VLNDTDFGRLRHLRVIGMVRLSTGRGFCPASREEISSSV